MLKTAKLPLLIGIIILLNGLIYLRAFLTIEDIEMVFAETARNSGRTSAAINAIILVMLGLMGLKRVFNKRSLKDAFRVLITIFAVNHLIHFFFVAMYFNSEAWELGIMENLHGFITFICIVTLPVILWKTENLNKVLYFGIILHLVNVTYFISHTFYARYTAEDPAYLHRAGVIFMGILVIYLLYRVYREKSEGYIVNES